MHLAKTKEWQMAYTATVNHASTSITGPTKPALKNATAVKLLLTLARK